MLDMSSSVCKWVPAWDQSFRMLDASSVPMLQAAFPQQNAVAWRTRQTPSSRYSIDVAAQIRPGLGRQMNVLLERSKDGFVSIAALAGHGLTVLRFQASTNTWQRLGSWARPGWISIDRCFAWRADLGAPIYADDQPPVRQLAIVVDGKTVLTTTVPSSTDRPQCGLGVQANTTGEWVRFLVTPR